MGLRAGGSSARQTSENGANDTAFAEELSTESSGGRPGPALGETALRTALRPVRMSGLRGGRTGQFIRAESAKWDRVIRSANVRLD